MHLEQFKPGDKVQFKIGRTGIVRQLVVNGKTVSNEAELQALLKTIEKSGKFAGEFVIENEKVLEVILGERQ